MDNHLSNIIKIQWHILIHCIQDDIPLVWWNELGGMLWYKDTGHHTTIMTIWSKLQTPGALDSTQTPLLTPAATTQPHPHQQRELAPIYNDKCFCISLYKTVGRRWRFSQSPQREPSSFQARQLANAILYFRFMMHTAPIVMVSVTLAWWHKEQ